MTGQVIFDPLLSVWIIAALALVALCGVIVAAWRRLPWWGLRGLAALCLLLALANPAWQAEDRAELPDIVVALVDQTASQDLPGRADQAQAALDHVQAQVAARGNTDLQTVLVPDGPDDSGTRLMGALNAALADLPRGRIAGVVAVTDGQVHDADLAPDLPAPFHVLLTGQADDWDRRLQVLNAPAFAILGEEITLTLRIDDMGAAPDAAQAKLDISVDGADPRRFTVPVGRDVTLPLTLPHGGMNVLHFTTPDAPGELTPRNNAAVVQINGVRDRLRVLLVSGEPHAGERTWRNLLKSDTNVDLVHFTILRPPEKQDGVPISELALIAFPTQELFMEKVDEFDLIIFDRYTLRGILPTEYLANIRRYVEDGGAILVSAGPEYAGAGSLYRSPLGAILPGAPTARVVEQAFQPALTDAGRKHPVTRDLPGADGPDWGAWLRLMDVAVTRGDVVMTGPDDRPLLILDRVGQGRVALLASDQAWLWGRGYDGGGPQLDLLRRLAHWTMKEPELEEDALSVNANGAALQITRRTLEDSAPPASITAPDGTVVDLPLRETAPGQFGATWDAPEMGLYRVQNGDLTTVAVVGPSAPREFAQTVASDAALAPVATATNGGVVRIADGLPRLRDVRAGRPAAGRGWIGITPQGAYQVAGVQVRPMLPPWGWLLLASGLILCGWIAESRRR